MATSSIRGVYSTRCPLLLEHSFGGVEKLESFLKGSRPTAEVAI